MTKLNETSKEGEEAASRNLYALQFPWKLHRLLEEAELTGDDRVISWLPGSKAFKVHDREEFARRIMPVYFTSAKYKTFQRSLNLWGFESVPKGPDRGACYHKYFVRGNPNLCEKMRRVKIKGQPGTTGMFNEIQTTEITPPMDTNSTETPAISDFIRAKKRKSLGNSQELSSLVPPRTMPLLGSDLLFKAALDRRRHEMLMQMSLNRPFPLLNLGSSSLNSFLPSTPPIQRTNPLQAVALAAAIASESMDEV